MKEQTMVNSRKGLEVWKMLMSLYETDREEDSRHRNNKRDF